jgi:hypothetical protein
MGFGLDECLLDNYLFTLAIITTLSNASHVPPSMAALLYRYSRWSFRFWIFPYRSLNLLEQCSLLPICARHGPPAENTSLLGNGYHVFLSDVSTHALPSNDRPIVAYPLLWELNNSVSVA